MTEPGDEGDSGPRGDVGFLATERLDVSGYDESVGDAADPDSADAESPAEVPAWAADVADRAQPAAAAEANSTQTESAAQAAPAGALEDVVPTGVPDDVAPTEMPDDAVPTGMPDDVVSEEASPERSAASTSAEFRQMLTAVTELGGQVDNLASATAELSRLRSRDTELIARLHDDVTKLRSGEIAAALNPVVTGMIKLHDQMVSLGALSDPASPVGMLHTQLLQIMELTCAVKPFTPAVGDRFDPTFHTGTRRRPTTDASLDGTVAAAIRAGFVRADGSVVRVAEVEVHRLSP